MKNIVSLCDGISCLQESLNKSGIEYDQYCSAEINPTAIEITQARYPKTIQLGDMRYITKEMLPENVYILGAGFPCKNTSIAGKKNGIVDNQGNPITSLEQYLKLKNENHDFGSDQSYLFWEVVRIIRLVNPKYILIENTKMSKQWKELITNELGIEPIQINSALVTAQNRERLYWTNIKNISIPENKHIHLNDVIPGAVGGYGVRGIKKGNDTHYTPTGTTRKDGKSNCITTTSNTAQVKLMDGTTRHLTINELEVLQSLPKDYTRVGDISNTRRRECIGNGWTIDVIAHLIKPLKTVPI